MLTGLSLHIRIPLLIWGSSYFFLLTRAEHWNFLFTGAKHSLAFPPLILLLAGASAIRNISIQNGLLMAGAAVFLIPAGILAHWLGLCLAAAIVLAVRKDPRDIKVTQLAALTLIAMPWPQFIRAPVQAVLSDVALNGVEIIYTFFPSDLYRLGSWLQVRDWQMLIAPGCGGLQLIHAGLTMQMFLLIYWKIEDKTVFITAVSALMLILMNQLRLVILLLLGDYGFPNLASEVHVYSSELVFIPGAGFIFLWSRYWLDNGQRRLKNHLT